MNPEDIQWKNLPRVPHPLLKYLDGNIHALTPGVDFKMTVKSFRSTIWRLADDRSLLVRTKLERLGWRGEVLYVQALDVDGQSIIPNPAVIPATVPPAAPDEPAQPPTDPPAAL